MHCALGYYSLFCTVSLYFGRHCHFLQNRIYLPCGCVLHPMHEISPLGIPIRQPICKPNPKMGSRDYKFLNPRSRRLHSLHTTNWQQLYAASMSCCVIFLGFGIFVQSVIDSENDCFLVELNFCCSQVPVFEFFMIIKRVTECSLTFNPVFRNILSITCDSQLSRKKVKGVDSILCEPVSALWSITCHGITQCRDCYL